MTRDHIEIRPSKYADCCLVYCVRCQDYWIIPDAQVDRAISTIHEFTKVHDGLRCRQVHVPKEKKEQGCSTSSKTSS